MKDRIKLFQISIAAIAVAILIGSSIPLVYSQNTMDDVHAEGVVTSSDISDIGVDDPIDVKVDVENPAMEVSVDGLLALVEVTNIKEVNPLITVEGTLTESEIDGFGVGDTIKCVINSDTMEMTCTNVTADTSATAVLEELEVDE